MIALLLASTTNASFMQSLMNVALDRICTIYGVQLVDANWTVLGYAIVTGTVITMASSLLKRFGMRRVMMAGWVFGIAGSALGLGAFCFPVLVAARLIQAVTTGLCFPVVNAALLRLSPKGKAGVLLSINSGVIGFGLALSPLITGLIITYLGLRMLFAVPLAFSGLLLVAGWFGMRDLSPRQDKRIDAVSAVLSLAGLGGLMFGLNEVTKRTLISVAIMAVAIGCVGAFVLRQRRLADPLLKLTPFKTRAFAAGEALAMLSYMGSMYLSLLAPLYLEGAAGKTPFEAGILLMVPILCYGVLCFASGRILGKRGVWPLVPAGFLILGGAFAALFFTSEARAVPLFLASAGAAYGAIGLFYPAVKSVDLEVLPPDLVSAASSIHSTLIQVAGSISSALFVGIMSSDVGARLAEGASKADAYAFGFSHTALIQIGLLAVALALSFPYVRWVGAWQRDHR